MQIIKNNSMRIVCFFIIAIIFLPLVLLMTDNIGQAVAYNSDILGYVESIKRFHYGIITGNINYALNMNTFGYGAGMFLTLAIITLPFSIFNMDDKAMLVILRTWNLMSLYGSFILIKKIFNEIKIINKEEKEKKYSDGLNILAIIIIILLPTTNLLITRVHPEIFQLLIFLCGVYQLCKYQRSKKDKHIIYSSLYFGWMVGIKISGILFIIFPLVYIIFSNLEINKKIKIFCIFGIIASIVLVITTCPLILIQPIEGISRFFNEFKYFSSTLKTNSISDFDNYKVLTTRAEVIKAWWSYIFKHGYISMLGVLIILINLFLRAIKEIQEAKPFKINCLVIIMFLLNAIYYTFCATRVSTYYYFIPMFLVIATYIHGMESGENKKIIYKITNLVLLLMFIPSLKHDIKIYKEQINLNYRLQKNEYRYYDLRTIIEDKIYPRKKIMLPTNVNLNISSKELNWIPYFEELEEGNKIRDIENEIISKENGVISSLQCYWKLEEVLQVNPNSLFTSDILVIDKLEEKDYKKYIRILQNKAMYLVYEDNYVVIMSKNAIPLEYEDINEELKNENNEQVDIEFEKGWDAINTAFKPAYNMKSIKEIQIEFVVEDIEKIDELKLVFNGYCDQPNENTWHYRIDRNELKKGYNKISINKDKFTLAEGYIDWNYVTNIVFGGMFEDFVEIKEFNITMK